MKKALLMVIVVLMTGCLSTSSYHTAQPVEVGETEIAVAMEATTWTDDDSGFVVAHPRIMVRRGISEEMDFGLRAGQFGIAWDLNRVVVHDDSKVISINPYIGWSMERFFGDGELNLGEFVGSVELDEHFMVVTALLGILVDFSVGDNSTLTVGAKPGFLNIRDAETGTTQMMIAASAGMKFDLGSSFVFPEVNAIKVENDEGFWLTFGVGVGF